MNRLPVKLLSNENPNGAEREKKEKWVYQLKKSCNEWPWRPAYVKIMKKSTEEMISNDLCVREKFLNEPIEDWLTKKLMCIKIATQILISLMCRLLLMLTQIDFCFIVSFVLTEKDVEGQLPEECVDRHCFDANFRFQSIRWEKCWKRITWKCKAFDF